MSSLNTSYWSISKVAIPVILGGFVQTFVIVIDNFFLSQVNDTAFNAAGTGGLLYLVLYMLAFGYASTAQIVIARRVGEGNAKKVGKIYWQVVWFMLGFASLLFLILFFFGYSYADDLLQDPELSAALGDFMTYRAWGIFFACLNLSFVSFYVGIARTGILVFVTMLTALLNVFLDWGFIFGNMGFPQMGLEGAALASSLSEATAFFFGAAYTIFFVKREKFGLESVIGIDKKLFWRLTKLSIPLMIQGFISFAAWFIFFIIVEKLGSAQYTISNAIRNVYSLVLIPLFGFNATAKTYVSGLIAEKRLDEVVPTIKKIVLLSVGATTLLLCGNIFFPDHILGIFIEETHVIEDGVTVMRVVIGSLFLFSIASILFQVVSGCGDTRNALFIELSAISIYLVFAWIITSYLKSDLAVVWTSEYIYFGLLALASIWYIRKGKWKTVKV